MSDNIIHEVPYSKDLVERASDNPELILIGEVRGKEAEDMIKAMVLPSARIAPSERILIGEIRGTKAAEDLYSTSHLPELYVVEGEDTLARELEKDPNLILIGDARGKEAKEIIEAMEVHSENGEPLEVGESVIVCIEEPVCGWEDLDESLNNQTAVVTEINSFVYPYIIKFDDPKIQRLIEETPRQFARYELKKI